MEVAKKIVLGILLTAGFAAGCGRGGNDSALNVLVARFDQLERRVAVSDRRAAVLERRLGDIEARLAAVEARSTAAKAGASTPSAAKVNAPTIPSSTAESPTSSADTPPGRKRQVESVAREYRSRMARIREQLRDNPDPAARREAMSELRAWRRAQVDAMRQGLKRDGDASGGNE